MSAIDTDNEARVGAPEDQEDGEFLRLKREVILGHRARSKWIKEAKECYKFVAGDQWAEEDRKILRDQNRPEVTFNRVGPLLRAVCGLEINNRQAVVYLPREMGDVVINETYTAAGKFIREETNADDEESEAFRDLGICGEGWTETRMEYDEEPTGKVVKDRIDPIEMGVNSGACKQNYKDARLVYRVRDIDPDDLRALLNLPQELLPEAMHAGWFDEDPVPADGGEGFKKDYPDKTRPGVSANGNTRPSIIRAVQVQYWRRETVYLVAGETGVIETSAEDYAKLKERAGLTATPVQATAVPKKVYYECFLGASTIFGHRKLPFNSFQFKCMTGERDRDKKCFYGMVRGMIDPQRWGNKFFSQSMHIMNQNAKGGIMAETDAFVNQRKAEKDWADPTKIVWVKPGALSKKKVQPRTPPPMPQGLSDMFMFAISSIRDVSGVNLELLGQADREQAASLEAQRRQSAMTTLAAMFNSLRRYRIEDGRLQLHFINLLPDQTLIRVMEQGKVKYIPLMKDPDIKRFDVIIDQAPTSPDQKQYVWGVTSQLLGMGLQLPMPVIVTLLKYSPYPESVVREITEAMGLGGQPSPEQMAEQLKQAEGALQVLEQQLVEAIKKAEDAEDKRALELMKLEIEEYRAETERMSAEKKQNAADVQSEA